MTTGQRVAYKRVSMAVQSSQRQLEGMSFDIEFSDSCSGKSTKRPALEAMLKHVRSGDTIFVHEISRLARNTQDLLRLVEEITGKGVTLEFVKESLTFAGDKTNPMNVLLLTMLGAVATFERDLINERSAEGRAVSISKGVHQGRTASLSKVQQQAIRMRPTESKAALAAEYGVSRATIYNVLKATS